MLLTGLMIISLLPMNTMRVDLEEDILLPSEEMMIDINIADRDALIAKYPDLALKR